MMFAAAVPSNKLSRHAFFALIGCTTGAVVLAAAASYLAEGSPNLAAIRARLWVQNFRGIFEQGIYAATVFWAAAKFIETRTLLTVGFDRQDAGGVLVQGPDEANTVWIGRRYGSRLEAEAVAVALQARLRASSTS